MSLITDFLRDVVATCKNAVAVGDTSREGRLLVSITLSLSFFFGFLALSGDLTSAACLTAGLEIVLLFMLSIL